MMTWLRCALFAPLCCALLVGCDSNDEPSVPRNALYNIVLSGQASFSGVPGQSFQVPGVLVLRPTNSEPQLDNGVNPVEVGIFTNASPIVGAAGALYFGTNTALSREVGFRQGEIGIDIAFVEVRGQRVRVTVDGNAFGLPAARLGTFNIYNLTSGVTAQIHNVLAGTIDVQFNDGAQTVNGTIQIGGSSGFGGPTVTSEYTASFTGTRAG